jgi:NADH-quinone oxidoreductase subunit L
MSGSVIDFSLAILLLPLASFLVLIFFGKRLPRGGDWLGTSILFFCLALSFSVLYQRINGPAAADSLRFDWIDFGNVPGVGPLKVSLGFAVDNLAAIMMAVVCIVSSLVHLFSIGYMRGDVRYTRYFAYLGIFTFSMLMIVVTDNFFMMYVGWELVGLSSYLLIGHWYEKQSASDAAKKAFIVNRIGDIGMFTGIMILYFTFRTFTFEQIFSMMAAGQIPMGSEAWLTAAGVLVFCGAVGKSAQFPLHVWLPDAMEGPTPVSALIHAATMVAAGVYLVARTFPMMTADALTTIAYVGAVTAFIAATIAIAQNDIKKVLAYSTVSQLGYMVMGLGVGAYTAGFFHLSTHAMFKAGLFLGSGSVIHAMHHAMHETHDHADPQDIRNMGGLKKYMPVTYLTFLMFTLAISGVPFTSGFLSKDELLAGTLAFGQHTGHWLIPIVGFLVAGMTAFYMFRLVFLTFFGQHAGAGREKHLHESPATMTVPLIVFAVLSFFAFYSMNPFGAAGGWFANAVPRPESVVPAGVAAMGREEFAEAMHLAHIPTIVLSLLVAGIGILVAFLTYRKKAISADAVAAKMPGLHRFLVNKWYFDELYGAVVVGGTLALTRALRWFDNTVVDGVVNGTAGWTRAVVFGYTEHRKDAKISSKFFLVAGIVVAALASWWAGAWIFALPGVPLGIFGAGLFTLFVGLLTLFFFWSGAGGFDRYVVDGLVNGVAYASGFFGLVLRKFQSGRVQTYIVFVVLGMVLLFYMLR